MSRHTVSRTLTACLLGAALVPFANVAAHDYPTYERVRYTLECMNRNGGSQALVYQCSCTIDKLANQFSMDEFVDMQTAVNASSIAGERGGELRDNPQVRSNAKRYRQAELVALQSCGVATR